MNERDPAERAMILALIVTIVIVALVVLGIWLWR
jgi:heme/copper-type cytochrome/quinol oxidase subunit 4